jgi:hypothetical protein
MDTEGQYSGIVDACKKGDPTIIGCNMACLSKLVDPAENDRLLPFKPDTYQTSAN